MSSGILLVLEGIDGAGTTTQARRLHDSLKKLGADCHLTREPSDGPIGRLLREILAGEHKPSADRCSGATTLGLLFAADRADHLEREICPALAANKVVISDRYYHSSLAYQGSDEDRGWVETLNKNAQAPERTFFLKVDPEVAAKRREAASREEEIFDRMETQKRVAAGYQKVMNQRSATESINVIDGHQSLNEISAQILSSAVALSIEHGLLRRSQ